MKSIKTPILKRVILVYLMCAGFISAQGQSMQMDMHHDGMTNRNVFLVMMDTMMGDMMSVPKSTSPTTVFLTGMIPHHEGAIKMAEYEIAHGKNREMIQLAKSIAAEQTSEIQQMQLWLKASPGKGGVPEGFNKAMDKTMDDMMANMPANATLKDTDHSFAQVMIPHHQAAIDMAAVLLRYASDGQIAAYAKQLIANQQVEIEQMKAYTK